MDDGKPVRINGIMGCKPTFNPNFSKGIIFEDVELQ
jgi:hypothetical protein